MRKILYNRDSPEIQPLKKLIQTHQAAKETQNPYVLGVISYSLTSLTYKYNDPNLITQKLQDYYNLLLYYTDNTKTLNKQWIKHLQDETKPNKELLLQL